MSNATNATGTCNYFMRGSLIAECSGHGTCVAEPPNEFMPNMLGRCVCDEGWQSDSDFQSATGMDCFHSKQVTNIWYTVNTVLYALSFLYTGMVLNSLKKNHGSKPGFLDKPSNKAIAVAVVFCVLRIIDAGMRIGTGFHSTNNLFVAIVHAAGGYTFWAILAASECEAFLLIVLGQAKMSGPEGEKMKKKCEQMHVLMKTLVPLAAPAYLAVIACYFVDNPETQKWFSLLYYINHFLMSYFLINRVALPVSGEFLAILNAMPNKDEKTMGLYNKVFIFNREVRNAGHFNTLSVGAMICWPMLWDAQGWQLMFAWMSCIPIVNVAAFLVHNDKGKAKIKPNTTSTTVE
jgi:hypothetical protein